MSLVSSCHRRRAVALLLSLVAVTTAFTPALSSAKRRRRSAPAAFFSRSKHLQQSTSTSLGIWKRVFGGAENDADDAETQEEPPSSVATAVIEKTIDDATITSSSSPEDQASRLRAEAERARLEADRMEAELTLSKISRLEKKLEAAKKRKSEDSTVVEDLQRQMEILERKLRGEAPLVATPRSPGASATSTPTSKTPSPPMSVEELTDALQEAPELIRRVLAGVSGVIDYDDASASTTSSDELNMTVVALALHEKSPSSNIFEFLKKPKPSFTQAQIDKQIDEMGGSLQWMMQATMIADAMSGGKSDNFDVTNDTQMALYNLEYDYYFKDADLLRQDLADQMDKNTIKISTDEFLAPLLEATSITNTSIEQLYPKCTRKGYDTSRAMVTINLLDANDGDSSAFEAQITDEASVPTLKEVEQLATQVLPKTPFSATSKPEPVLGGFVIKGVATGATSGDDLLAAIDEQLAKTPNLQDKLTVLYANDFTVYGDPDVVDALDFDPEANQLLYVLGPDIVRERRRVALTTTSALGIATSWYLSIYPFLLNPDIAKRVDEQLAIADANMVPDLTWLTDLSLPLFVTFIGIQLLHEAGHSLAAAANGMKTSVPTFVPSIITGITSSVTTFREPPKNKEAMFDFSVAGPLVGIAASLVAVTVGAQLTLASDPANLPALPLEILRQSTLGGAIINNILGNGVLNVPEGALGTSAVAGMTIPLHPVAVAGYIALVVNALSLLPVGTTDGGRVALTLFGRASKLLVGNSFLIAIFVVGFLGSDLFLFYFAFLIAFQSGNEIPARNEVDKIGFSRVLVAMSAFVLSFLSLVPFQ